MTYELSNRYFAFSKLKGQRESYATNVEYNLSPRRVFLVTSTDRQGLYTLGTISPFRRLAFLEQSSSSHELT